MAAVMRDKQFEALVAKGNPVGEIIGIDSFMVKIRGLQPTNVHALLRFEDGSKGYVHHIYEDYVVAMKLSPNELQVGMVVVVHHEQLLTKVGKNYIGRVVDAFGDPIDGKGPIEPDDAWEVFHNAPMLYERELLDTQLETGITVLDINFSLVRGQRMAVLGEGKVGKTAMTTQIAINQKNTDITVIYVLIAKRQRDVAQLVDRLEKNEALNKAIIIVTNMFESLVLTYLAPYIGAAHGEYFWQKLGLDTLVVYDDLTSHAQAYREISLIAGVSPGRDSYPGDMFYTHSSLVERAGRLGSNHASQTILPIVYAPAGDITAYLPTNVMSMTDGQWILDMNIFKDTMRPAINTGLSVTRVGGVGQNKRQKALAAMMNKTLAGYRQAEEYAHFGTELSPEAQADYDKGKNLFRLMNQDIGEGYSLMDQQFMLDIVLGAAPAEKLDIKLLKDSVKEYSAKVVEEGEQSNFDTLRDELKAKVLMAVEDKKPEKPGEPPAPADTAGAAPADGQNDKKAEDQTATPETAAKADATAKPEAAVAADKPADGQTADKPAAVTQSAAPETVSETPPASMADKINQQDAQSISSKAVEDLAAAPAKKPEDKHAGKHHLRFGKKKEEPAEPAETKEPSEVTK
jgi:F-type H+-transporting ATPase subunit alpha